MAAVGAPRTILLVEGTSDRAAVLAVAAARGRDLTAEGVAVVAMGGATNVGRHLTAALTDPGVVVAGLFDAGEERFVRGAVRRAGLGAAESREALEALGFFACVKDLEDELLRALGVAAALAVVAQQGELGLFRTFQDQPFHRGRPVAAQLHRFIGTTSGRKARLDGALAAALPADRVPRPIAALLDHVDIGSPRGRAVPRLGA